MTECKIWIENLSGDNYDNLFIRYKPSSAVLDDLSSPLSPSEKKLLLKASKSSQFALISAEYPWDDNYSFCGTLADEIDNTHPLFTVFEKIWDKVLDLFEEKQGEVSFDELEFNARFGEGSTIIRHPLTGVPFNNYQVAAVKIKRTEEVVLYVENNSPNNHSNTTYPTPHLSFETETEAFNYIEDVIDKVNDQYPHHFSVLELLKRFE